MNCKEINKTLLNDSIFELPEHILEKIQTHIFDCDDCSKLYKAAIISGRISENTSKLSLDIDYSETRENVLKNIQIPPYEYSGKSPIEKFLAILINPQVRLVYVTMILFISVSFLTIELRDFSRISALEEKYKLESLSFQPMKTVKSISNIDLLYRKVLNGIKSFGTEENEVIISNTELINILELFIGREIHRNHELNDYLKQNKISLEDGLDIIEAENLVNLKDHIQNILIDK
ncbi:hypothetical protein ACFLS9_07110 [Bacteroidota bacterium]